MDSVAWVTESLNLLGFVSAQKLNRDLRPFIGQTDPDVYDILRQAFRPFQLLSPVYGGISLGQSDANQPTLFGVGLTPLDGTVTAQLHEVSMDKDQR